MYYSYLSEGKISCHIVTYKWDILCLMYCFHYKVVLFSMVFSIYLPFFFAAYKCVNLQKIKKKIVTKSLNLLQSNNKLMKRHKLSSLFLQKQAYDGSKVWYFWGVLSRASAHQKSLLPVILLSTCKPQLSWTCLWNLTINISSSDLYSKHSSPPPLIALLEITCRISR